MPAAPLQAVDVRAPLVVLRRSRRSSSAIDPIIALSGVRSSWLRLATNRFRRVTSSADCFASPVRCRSRSSAASTARRAVKSRVVLVKPTSFPSGLRRAVSVMYAQKRRAVAADPITFPVVLTGVCRHLQVFLGRTVLGTTVFIQHAAGGTLGLLFRPPLHQPGALAPASDDAIRSPSGRSRSRERSPPPGCTARWNPGPADQAHTVRTRWSLNPPRARAASRWCCSRLVLAGSRGSGSGEPVASGSGEAAGTGL